MRFGCRCQERNISRESITEKVCSTAFLLRQFSCLLLILREAQAKILPFVLCHQPFFHATGKVALSQGPAFWIVLPGRIL